MLYAVGFFCGVQNVVGGAAYQVLIAQMAGRERLVEANAKITLGETSSALIGPGIAGGLIQLLTAPFAIVARRAVVPRLRADAAPAARAERRRRRRVRGSRWAARSAKGWRSSGTTATLRSLALVAGAWQFLHHMQIAVLILFATRDLGLSAGALGIAYMSGGARLRDRGGLGRAAARGASASVR